MKVTSALAAALVLALGCAQPSEDDMSTDKSFPALPALDATIMESMQSAHVPGLSACIIKDGAIQWCSAYGLANIVDEREVSVDTPFLLASVSKLVAGAAVMHGWQENSIDLDQSVSSFLPFPVQHPTFPAEEVTTRMLLTHQAGITDNWDILEELYSDGDPMMTLGGFLQDYLAVGGQYYAPANFLATSPGAVSDYSNIGAALGAYALEAKTGIDFASYCDKKLFDPLGLARTSWSLAGMNVENIALPYEWLGGNYESEGHYGFPDYPSGQLRSSASDMARFLLMLMNDGEVDGVRVLETATVAEMRRLQIPDNDEQGIIWYYSDVDGQQVLGHDGAELGAMAELKYRPSDGVGVVILMNAESDTAMASIMSAMFLASADL